MLLRPDTIRNAIRTVILVLAVSALPAHAEEFVYSPEGCDFQVTFPGEPHAVRRCHDKLTDKCDLMTSYTHVFDLDATVNIYVSCKPSAEDFRKSFTPDLMRTSLLARPNVDLLEVYDISLSDTDEAMMGALFGAGHTANGNDQMIFVTQIWLSDDSVLTFEGEMVGAQTDEADKLFGDILRSLRHKDWKEQTAPETKTETPVPEGETTPSAEAPAEDGAAKNPQNP